jgi:hypothetical protein
MTRGLLMGFLFAWLIACSVDISFQAAFDRELGTLRQRAVLAALLGYVCTSVARRRYDA